jgi:lysophospholipase L1-like esterase
MRLRRSAGAHRRAGATRHGHGQGDPSGRPRCDGANALALQLAHAGGAPDRGARRPAGRRKRPSWLAPIALAVLTVVLTLGLLELTLRAVPSLMPVNPGEAAPVSLGVAHPYIGHLHTPHARKVVEGKDFSAVHETDGHGFRNAWPWPERAEIIALGDSLTFGYGVAPDRAWPSILGRALPGLRAINLGLVGASAPQYQRVYEVFGAPLRPAVLVVGVFAQNDFWDAGLFDRWLRSGVGGNYMVWRDTGRRGGEDDESKGSVMSTLYALAHSSSVVRLARHAWREVVFRPVYHEFPDGSRLRLLPRDFAEKTVGAEPSRPEFRIVLESLLELSRRARADGAEVLIAFLPSKEEVYLPLLGVAVKDPGQHLRHELAKQGIDHVDLAPTFRERARAGHRLFFEEDGHPNAEGNELIAEAVLRALRARLGLDGVRLEPR